MTKHGFKLGGTGKQVMVVPPIDVVTVGDVGTVPTIALGTVEAVADMASDVAAAQDANVAYAESVAVAMQGAAPEADVEVLTARDLGEGENAMGDVLAMWTAESDAIGGDLDSTVADVVASMVAEEPSEPAKVDVVAPPVVVPPVRAEVALTLADMARFVAGDTVELTVGGRVVGIMVPVGGVGGTPGGGGGKRSARVTSAAPRMTNGATVATSPGLTVAGDWTSYDARIVCTHPGNASNIKTWDRIRNAAEKLDLDALLAMDFAGAHDDASGNTYTKNNGRFLRAHIANVKRVIAEREAALDAEFGFKLAAD